MSMLVYSLLIAHLLLLWFQTDAAGVYGKLFFRRLPCWRDYAEVQENHDPHLQGPYTFLRHIRAYHPGRLASLLSCPICLSTWLGILAALIVGKTDFLVTGFLGLFGYLTCVSMMNHADRTSEPHPGGHRAVSG